MSVASGPTPESCRQHGTEHDMAATARTGALLGEWASQDTSFLVVGVVVVVLGDTGTGCRVVFICVVDIRDGLLFGLLVRSLVCLMLLVCFCFALFYLVFFCFVFGLFFCCCCFLFLFFFLFMLSFFLLLFSFLAG